MQMTEQEICKEYREAKDPNHQLTILAQLNTCKTEDIVEILTRNGETLRKRPYQRNAKPEKITVKKKEEDIPACVFMAVKERIDWLEIKIQEMHIGLKDYEDQYKQLNRYLKQHVTEDSDNK